MKELIEIQHKLVAKKGQRNDFGRYSYRSAEDILESVKPLLFENKCMVTLTDELILVGDRYYIKAMATIINEKDKSISCFGLAREALQQKGMSDGQITGASSSYARKYALNGLFAIAENDDLDSHSNEPVKRPPPSKANDQSRLHAWKDFSGICETMGVDPTEFLSENVDMTDKTATYAEVRKWLQNEQLLKDQLISWKNA